MNKKKTTTEMVTEFLQSGGKVKQIPAASAKGIFKAGVIGQLSKK